ncbi:MAG: transposase, partial [Oscillospiraceae bacterium]|nr:transposase [Oscillospiraceae bacterium]
MSKITQDMRFKQAVIEYSFKNGVTKAAIHYKTTRQNIYRWRKKYDGTLQSLADRSHRPHSHPNQHTEAEIKLIKNMRRRNPNAGLVVFWVKLCQRGYTRSISGLYRVLRRINGNPVKLPNPKYTPKPYEQMKYPGQKGQIDVKFVPQSCLVGEAAEEKFYQYTFIDEYSRFRILKAYKEHSTYSSAQFLKYVVKKFPYAIECIQTDNGSEFTNAMNNSKKVQPTLFEKTLSQLGIQHKRIKVYTPRHNGKVERSHRKDNEEFYACHKFYSFADFEKQLAVRQRQYNNFPMRPLNWKSPKH